MVKIFRLYNTAGNSVQDLELIEPGRLSMYACGPTVYSTPHIGNFRSFLTADLIVRTARAIGLETTYVSNITDVGHLTDDDLADGSGEDKMTRALTSKDGKQFANIWELADFYTQTLLDGSSALNLLPPEVRPRATQHMREQILAVEELIKKGHAYETEDAVYFSVASFPSYGELSGNTEADNLELGVREVVQDSNKKDPRDFALWKKDNKHLMQWHSPWGWGFPGWHIECSVMAMKYLGETFDIHAGGEDLIFPHHECEKAQSQSLTSKKFCNHWVHTRFLQVEGAKMSKSSGNFYTISDLIDGDEITVDPFALRYSLISGHYRQPYNFTLKHLSDSSKVINRYRNAIEKVDQALELASNVGDLGFEKKLGEIYDRTLNAMLNDLKTPDALAAALEGIKEINTAESLSLDDARHARMWLDRTNSLLGIVEYDNGEASEQVNESKTRDELSVKVDTLLEERKAAREKRDWTRADLIREELDELGVVVKDTAQGTTWHKKTGL